MSEYTSVSECTFMYQECIVYIYIYIPIRPCFPYSSRAAVMPPPISVILVMDFDRKIYSAPCTGNPGYGCIHSCNDNRTVYNLDLVTKSFLS